MQAAQSAQLRQQFDAGRMEERAALARSQDEARRRAIDYAEQQRMRRNEEEAERQAKLQARRAEEEQSRLRARELVLRRGEEQSRMRGEARSDTERHPSDLRSRGRSNGEPEGVGGFGRGRQSDSFGGSGSTSFGDSTRGTDSFGRQGGSFGTQSRGDNTSFGRSDGTSSGYDRSSFGRQSGFSATSDSERNSFGRQSGGFGSQNGSFGNPSGGFGGGSNSGFGNSFGDYEAQRGFGSSGRDRDRPRSAFGAREGNYDRDDEDRYYEQERRRDIADSWKMDEAAEELNKIQSDLEMKQRQLEKMREPGRLEGSTMRMAGDDLYEARRRSEEAREWAQQEASRKRFSVGLDGENAGRRGSITDPMEHDRIRNTYRRWCQFYGKQYDENRLDTFAENLFEAERFALSRGGRVELSAFADLTAAEYRRREEDISRWGDFYPRI